MLDWSKDGLRDELRSHWNLGLGKKRIARAMTATRGFAITIGMIAGQARRMRLKYRQGRGTILLASNSAVIEGRTQYTSSVRGPDRNILKSGDNQSKLGALVTKGKWKGFPIYSLTLEERKTCPRACHQFRSCYGNNMPFAVRYDYGLPLELQIWRELAECQRDHPDGFVVRLHLLGDFYSVDYVRLWQAALDHFPALRVFGYTAWQSSTRIGSVIAELRDAQWERFAIRTSGAYMGPRTGVVQRHDQKQPDHIICPVQVTERTKDCGHCGLCWQTRRPIVFLRH